ncbi:sensor histidine kinase [Streptomyces sp. TRM68367]|uniref:sensor histidine kinase n=1 Tax=Streptomyces sp. TRM68367 TaxID=2758415 RepID=UPI00165B25A7|nr:sensor histidine kinase [Streptomyces sp. TRM68367]MBC9727282.1 sensor histidine kinase [Streptomyces sp. TRM68367]
MASDTTHRPRLPRGRAADLALACGVFLPVAVWSAASLIREPSEPWPLTALGWLLIVTACGALYLRRRYPVAVAVCTLAATAAYYLTSAYDGPLMVVVIVALYSVAAEGLLRAAVALAAVTEAGVMLGTLAGNEDINSIALFMLAGWLVAVVALGAARHGRFAFAEEEARRRATEERLRIARELHDVIGHNVSLINVQAGAALHRLKKHPEQAEEALAAIKESSREALRELRTTLGVLRQVDERAPTQPAPGLDRLDELVAAAKPAGLDIRVHSRGRARELPAAVDLAAFRIVQESLTNVTRHARGATAVEVRLGFGERELSLAVEDDGDATGPVDRRSAGHGIKGMRERAATLGGELSAGPGPNGGFAVTARIPYEN